VTTRHWPVFGSLQGYRGTWLRSDLIAGLTVWAVLVPELLAYASIAGLPPVVGLYAAVPALIFYAMIGSSHHLIVGLCQQLPPSRRRSSCRSLVATVPATSR
jgi:sulfate permease, SulP family